jgi:hypothetical protein
MRPKPDDIFSPNRVPPELHKGYTRSRRFSVCLNAITQKLHETAAQLLVKSPKLLIYLAPRPGLEPGTYGLTVVILVILDYSKVFNTDLKSLI